MKLERLSIDQYKNLHDCTIEFDKGYLLNAIIGGNGTGKSNLIEAILQILIGIYFKSPPQFGFEIVYESRQRRVRLRGESGRVVIDVDGSAIPLAQFAARLRDGPAQVYYPELTFVYYSGECDRIRRLINRYRRHFHSLTRNADTDNFKPLFVESSNQQTQVILLSLFAHKHKAFLDLLRIKHVIHVALVLRSPESFNSNRHEPKLWNTVGAVRKIIAAIDETAAYQESNRQSKRVSTPLVDVDEYLEDRIYYFNDADESSSRILDLADRLARAGDNLYLALEQLRYRGVLREVRFQLRGNNKAAVFQFDQLSEGEKQLIAVVGALRLTNQRDNLVLLDEPNTHLNPHWTWDYPEMLSDAFDEEQAPQSTVLMATHDPVMISGLVKEQVILAHPPLQGTSQLTRPVRNPRGQGIANVLCSSEFFGLPSSLDKESQKMLDERLSISVKPTLTDEDRRRLKELNEQLEFILPGVSERDPVYVEFLRRRSDLKE